MFKFILLFLFSIISVISYADSFILNSVSEATALSEKTKQPILLIFGSENCIYCKSLEQDLTNCQLTNDIQKYIVCYIDVTTNQGTKEDYQVTSVPDSRIIINNVQKSKATGYNKKQYLEWLKNAK